jgi:hypothetical protein
MRVNLATLLVTAAMIVGSFAEQIQEGAKMEVKPDSIWFLEVGNLSTWQKLKKSGNPTEFESFSNQGAWCPTCLAVLEATHGQNHQLRASKESGQGGTADTGPVSREYVVDRWECFCEIKATDCGNREAITIVPHDSRPDARQELKPRRRRLLSRSLVRPKRAPKGELMSTA